MAISETNHRYKAIRRCYIEILTQRATNCM